MKNKFLTTPKIIICIFIIIIIFFYLVPSHILFCLPPQINNFTNYSQQLRQHHNYEFLACFQFKLNTSIILAINHNVDGVS